MLKTEIIKTFKDAARKMKGSDKREFVAKITIEHLGGSARKAESVFSWNRKMVFKGLRELESGIVCLPDYSKRDHRKTEYHFPDLAKDIEGIIENEVQTDPKFRTNKKYCKITAMEVCRQLSQKEKYAGVEFERRTISNVLNRLGYSLKKH